MLMKINGQIEMTDTVLLVNARQNFASSVVPLHDNESLELYFLIRAEIECID